MSMIAFALGGLAWSASEYALHRWVAHGRERPVAATVRGKLTLAGLAAELKAEHVAHHVDPMYFSSTATKVQGLAVVLPLAFALVSPVLGVRRGSYFSLGFGLVYGAYELTHRHIHTRGPNGRYGAWVRQHHLLHHHKTTRRNYAVTSPLWDLTLSTLTPLERVSVPRNVAPAWLLDSSGEVLHKYRSSYQLVGTSQ